MSAHQPLQPGDIPAPMTARERRRLAALDQADMKRALEERPNVESKPFNPDRTSWESFCPGNRTNHHGWPEAKIIKIVDGREVHRWRCGSCGNWLVVSPERIKAGR